MSGPNDRSGRVPNRRGPWIGVLAGLALGVLAMVGVDTDLGRVSVTRGTVLNAWGDKVSYQLYRPKAATAEAKVPVVLTNHGGSDCISQFSMYNVELARRGYVVISWDSSSQGLSQLSKDPSQGGEAIFAMMNTLSFVDRGKVILAGHSMGGLYTFMVAQNHQDQVIEQINIGYNQYGKPEQGFGFNFGLIMGLGDESALAKNKNDIRNVLTDPKLVALVGSTGPVEAGKVYGDWASKTARVVYMPQSLHAYYLINGETCTYFLRLVEAAAPMPRSIAPDSHVFWIKDLAMILELLSLSVLLFLMLSSLLKLEFFASLRLPQDTQPAVGFAEGSPGFLAATLFLLIAPALTYLWAMRTYPKLPGLWLMAGTPNGYVLWGWATAILLLLGFLIFHFVWGKKHGGGSRAYGFASHASGPVATLAYLGRSLLLALGALAPVYLVYLLVYQITQSNIHVTTFMMNPIPGERSPAFLVYFLFQIPYFLCGSLAMSSIVPRRGSKAGLGAYRPLALGLAINTALLILGYIIFVVGLGVFHSNFLMKDRLYIAAIGILPLVLTLFVANSASHFLREKTGTIYPGLFVALLWSTWLMTGANAIARLWY